jgi:hypothetical protein
MDSNGEFVQVHVCHGHSVTALGFLTPYQNDWATFATHPAFANYLPLTGSHSNVKLRQLRCFTSNLVACALAMMLGIAARATKPPSE